MTETTKQPEQQETHLSDIVWHYRHPTDINRTWCGKETTWSTPCKSGTNKASGKEGCIICADLYATYGSAWYARVHNAAFPNCTCFRKSL